MARASAWRQLCPPQVRALQELACLKPLFLLRQSGPTAFIVQEDEAKPVQVRLGDPHHCSCKMHQKTKDLCLHICWVLLKKLQLKHLNPLSFQLGLVSRELGDLLEPRRQHRTAPRKPARSRVEQQAAVPRRHAQPEDICPICLIRFGDSQLPVVHCRYSCGNAVHTRCMVQVARHQLDCQELGTDRLLTCPLCRGPFCRGSELAEAAKKRPQARTRALSPVGSHDVACVFCRVHPIVGNLYRCLQCSQVVMCAACVNCAEYRDLHDRHGYAIKKDKWETVRPPNWEPAPVTKSVATFKQQVRSDAGLNAQDRRCAYCSLGFPETEQWAGKWQDLLLHMSCVDQWRADPFRACSLSSRKGAPGGLPMIDLSTLLGPPEVRVVRLSLSTRPQDPRAPAPAPELPRAPRPPRPPPNSIAPIFSRKGAPGGLPMIDLSTLLGPPEVRVVRLSLSTRPQDPRAPAPAPELPRALRPPRPPHSPLRLRPRRPKKKKSQKSSSGVDIDNNKLPLSVTLGRALGAQVQPLMAILMSPRVRTSSLNSDDSAEEDHSDEEAKTSPKSKTPLLSITSLELPELAPARNPACQPVRRVRTSVRRSRPPPPPTLCATSNTQAQNISCAGLALAKK